jgi:hypothetical protein
MAVHDRLDLGMGLVDLAVDKSFEIDSPALPIALLSRSNSMMSAAVTSKFGTTPVDFAQLKADPDW